MLHLRHSHAHAQTHPLREYRKWLWFSSGTASSAIVVIGVRVTHLTSSTLDGIAFLNGNAVFNLRERQWT